MPYCERALMALYALVNSNRSAPPSISRAWNCKLFSFCVREPTGLDRLSHKETWAGCIVSITAPTKLLVRASRSISSSKGAPRPLPPSGATARKASVSPREGGRQSLVGIQVSPLYSPSPFTIPCRQAVYPMLIRIGKYQSLKIFIDRSLTYWRSDRRRYRFPTMPWCYR